MLCTDDSLLVEDRLEEQSSRYLVSASIASGFRIRLANGEGCESLSRVADFKNDDWEDLFVWLADALLRMKQLIVFLDWCMNRIVRIQ
jgi:hypothetical protein